ncbi:predicted protein [Postia placenta Mad-698-R]|nr:predicted protein [Postia placenta Mad-698-R]
MYGPIIVPQLWCSCLPKDPSRLLNDHVARIQHEEELKVTCKKKAAEAKRCTQQQKELVKEQKKAAKVAEHTCKAAMKQAAQACRQNLTQGTSAPGTLLAAIDALDIMATHSALNDLAANTYEDGDGHVAPGMQENGDGITNSAAGPSAVPPDLAQEELPYAMHPADPTNFLKLSQALQFLGICTITHADLDHADKLLWEYNSELITLYGSAALKSNNHYSIHTADFATKDECGTVVGLAACELCEILQFQQNTTSPHMWFGRMRWALTLCTSTIPGTALWWINEYLLDEQQSQIIDLSWIKGLLGCTATALRDAVAGASTASIILLALVIGLPWAEWGCAGSEHEMASMRASRAPPKVLPA